MRIAVFTPTRRYGGLRETYRALRAQTHKDFVWIVVDALHAERADLVREYVLAVTCVHEPEPPRPPGYYSNLPAIYNRGLELAASFNAELFVSLQDYFWVPKNGLERFGAVAQRYPGALITGLASIADNPPAMDPTGLWSIFDSMQGPPERTWWWEDVRDTDLYPGSGGIIADISPVEWEMNWASIPMRLYRAGLRFDEAYGEHLGHENVDFAMRAYELGARVHLDKDNYAVGYPHRLYWPEESEEAEPHREVNLERFRAQWGHLVTT